MSFDHAKSSFLDLLHSLDGPTSSRLLNWIRDDLAPAASNADDGVDGVDVANARWELAKLAEHIREKVRCLAF